MQTFVVTPLEIVLTVWPGDLKSCNRQLPCYQIAQLSDSKDNDSNRRSWIFRLYGLNLQDRKIKDTSEYWITARYKVIWKR